MWPSNRTLGRPLAKPAPACLDIADGPDMRGGDVEQMGSGHDVGRLERRVGSGLETREQRGARAVAILAVDRAGVEAERREALSGGR
jgi:hypothetical protein